MGFYQSLLGVLPADFDPNDGAACDEIRQRMRAFMEKAVREAKQFTSWTAPNEPYEEALLAFVDAAFEPAFLRSFWERVQPFVVAGALTSLSQTLVRLGAPGVPDIYQGTEFYDNSLVDPDNRRLVDFDARLSVLRGGEPVGAAAAHWRDGCAKARLTAAGLAARGARPGLFTVGDYVPWRWKARQPGISWPLQGQWRRCGHRRRAPPVPVASAGSFRTDRHRARRYACGGAARIGRASHVRRGVGKTGDGGRHDAAGRAVRRRTSGLPEHAARVNVRSRNPACNLT